MPRTVKKDANLKPGKPLKPENLSTRAAIEWDRLVSELDAAQIQVSTAHRALRSLAATIAADIGQAWEVVKAEGAYIRNEKTGVVQVHPASKTLNELLRDYVKILVTLGTTLDSCGAIQLAPESITWRTMMRNALVRCNSNQRFRVVFSDRQSAGLYRAASQTKKTMPLQRLGFTPQWGIYVSPGLILSEGDIEVNRLIISG
jgi:phage terminase small subunit